MQDAKEPIFPDWLKKNFILNTFLKVAFEELVRGFNISPVIQGFPGHIPENKAEG